MHENTLHIDGLSKRYGDTVALDSMSFSVAPGEIYGFVGSNGAGKTTTMRIALGVLQADSGEVRVGSRIVDDALRRSFGYMPEERGLYPKQKVAEQLNYFAQLHGLDAATARRNTAELLERLGLSDRAKDKLQELSLGNQQRVQLAAALVFDPQVLILDEPFSGLDPVAVEVMAESLRERAERGIPVVFSSHQLDLVQRLCDRVGIVKSGRMVAEGSVDELRRSGPVLYEITTPATSDWWEPLEGVDLVERHGDTVVLSIGDAPAEGYDDQPLLKAALAAGPVHHFGRRLPSLTELFQEVVSQ
ncbi:putative ABC transporter ATP-binding protein YbhF [Corynebacterium ciconiae DSM 44920]|uniref:ABC transporter ATP-binding protein n=1 Tax=Corynebacterium ciconiae TaxID=227319 RepID=UPI00035C4556|nr:ATP-binding cassette domain-containing protein [Corynebacterium ciconiae]WKD61703.1 putative ABC transporter ATP-binding protein YbhF [Corynebacterium ciconiae DSM 44920]